MEHDPRLNSDHRATLPTFIAIKGTQFAGVVLTKEGIKDTYSISHGSQKS